MPVTRLAALLVLATALSAFGQSEQSAVPYIPPEESPFFIVRDAEKETGPRKQRDKGAQDAFPRNKHADRSAGNMFTGFFTEMFASVSLGSDEKKSGSKLIVEPKDFSLDERREVQVDFTVFNKTNRLMKLEFPTSQRIEIIVRDPAGAVIERWSDDRAFDEQAGVVMINPDERIEYSERIATREMVPGTIYTIEASVANNPEFTRTTQVNPTGKLELPPPPVPGEGEAAADEQPAEQPAADPTQG